MKKTTYILAGVLSALLVFCFISPAVFSHSDETGFNGNITLNHKDSLPQKTVYLPAFSKLSGLMPYSRNYKIVDSTNERAYPRLRIEVSDSVSSPLLILNSWWENLISFKVEIDRLLIDVNEISILRDYCKIKNTNNDNLFVTITVPDDCLDVGVILMPRGMLTEIEDNYLLQITLSEFRNANLTIGWNVRGITFDNCSFKYMEIENYR